MVIEWVVTRWRVLVVMVIQWVVTRWCVLVVMVIPREEERRRKL
jgi:hypothetical protein